MGFSDYAVQRKTPECMRKRRSDFKSNEEYHFYAWLLEAYAFGYVSSFSYESSTFMLMENHAVKVVRRMKTKEKTVEVNLFSNTNEITYTPDFIVFLTSKGVAFFGDNVFDIACQCMSTDDMVFVDVKGGFSSHRGTSEFFLKQRLMWEKHGVFVHKIVPFKFFAKTWVPRLIAWDKRTAEPTRRSKYAKCLLSKEYGKAYEWRMKQQQKEQ